MRLLIGIALGVALTIGGAYLYDSRNAATALDQPTVSRAMVNWDVVNAEWRKLTDRARAEWSRLQTELPARNG